MAIIAIVAAITFPAFSSAKKAAFGRQSVSDMRQIALAVHVYREDWKRADVGDMTSMGLPPDYPRLFHGSMEGLKPGLRPPIYDSTFPFYYYMPVSKELDGRFMTWEQATEKYGDRTVLVCDPWIEGRHPSGWWRASITSLPNRLSGIDLGSQLVKKRPYGNYAEFAPWVPQP